MTETHTRAPCRRCHTETKHLVLNSRVTQGSDEAGGHPLSWADKYEMLECCGCELVSLRHLHWSSDTGEDDVTYYPPPVSRQAPVWRRKLPARLRSLLDEIYTALHADSRRLALMGARTAVDMVLVEKVGDHGSFPRGLESLEQQGFVGKRHREFLAAALDAGHAAAHRGFVPKKDELAHVMDIVENVLQAVYVLEGAAAELRRATPQRARKR